MIEQARRAAAFVLDRLQVDGTLHRVYRLGQVKQEAFLDDYAGLAEGLLELFESTGEARWLEAARGLAGRDDRPLLGRGAGNLRLDPAGAQGLLQRVPAVHDNATPSAGRARSTPCCGCTRSPATTGAGAVADRYLRQQREELARNPFAFGHLLSAAWLQLRGIVEVAVLGPAGAGRDALLAAARDGYRPEILAFAAERGIGEIFTGRGALDGSPAAYVCRAFACEAARTDARELARALEGS